MTAYKRLECKGQPLIYRSLKKYGHDTHKIEFLYKELTRKEAELIEIAMIEVYKSFKSSLNISEGGSTAIHINGKKVLQFNTEGEFIKEWSTPSEVQRQLGLGSATISHAARGKSFYAHGFLWVYKKDYEIGVVPYWKNKAKTTLSKQVHQYDRFGKFIQTFPSCEEAARIVGYKTNTVKASCIGKSRISKQFIFSFEKKEIQPYLSIVKKRSKKVFVYDVNRNFVSKHPSATEAGLVFGIPQSSMYTYAAKNKLVNQTYYFTYEQY
jgi:hypothetical protein